MKIPVYASISARVESVLEAVAISKLQVRLPIVEPVVALGIWEGNAISQSKLGLGNNPYLN